MRALVLSLGLLAGMSLPLAALDLDRLSDAERAAFRAEVRAYLLANPEVLMEALDVLQGRQASVQAAAEESLVQTNAEAIFADGHSWVGGNPEGDVTLVEFTDYRCGYCRKAHEEVAELVKSDGNIRFVIKEFPILGEQSLLSSRFAIATRLVAGDEAYKKMHDALITLRGDATPAALERLAAKLGLDGAAITAHLNEQAVNDALNANSQLAATLEISGTPTFVLQDRLMRGYVPLDEMRDLVAQVRAE